VIDNPEFFERLYELLKHDELRKALFVVLPTTLLAGAWIGRRFPKHSSPPPPSFPDPDLHVAKLQAIIDDLKHQLTVTPDAVERAQAAVSTKGLGLWLAIPPSHPTNYELLRSSIPIYTIANLKGGVGKTTIAIGLASYFVNPFGKPGRRRERVLLIDLDFQGSLSSMALTTNARIPMDGQLSRATRLISGVCEPEDLIAMQQRVKGLDVIKGGGQVEFNAIPAYYDLAQAENRLMVEWLLSDGHRDIRYNVAELLLSPVVQRHYDRIIIDAPPRLTTAHVQALAASTHVIIPTVLDQLSGEAVGSFVEQTIFHAKIWPYLKVLGVVGSMTEWGQDKELQDYENGGMVAIQQALEQKKDQYALRGDATKLFPRTSYIPELRELGRAAGTRIGYLSVGGTASERAAIDKVRAAFDCLGEAVVAALPEAKELRDLVRS
jgi:chromosome partitioning protein